jgi:hypothetical protein
MGKPVLVSLLAAALFFCAARTGTAQQAEPEPEAKPAWSFTPGQFLTADDYEHLKAALDCINLKPEDLNYQKKHRPDDILRLSICDKALDDPLAVPGMAETAADKFGSKSSPTQRAMHAAGLLDLPETRWTAEELQADGNQLRKLWDEANTVARQIKAFKGDRESREFKKLQEERDRTAKAIDQAENRALFGEDPQALLPDSGLEITGRMELSSSFTAAANSLTRKGTHLSKKEMSVLAGEVASIVAESDIIIPGGVRAEGEYNVFDQGSRAHLEGILVAAARVRTILADRARLWQTEVDMKLDSTRGTLDHNIPGVTGSVVSAWQSKWGKVVIGGTGPNTYEGDDFIGIIDLGGDDVYRGRVACGIGLEGHAPISFVLDLSGNDRYEGGDFTQGFGFLGVGILHDLGGGDDYYSAGFCAQGCGLCGYGELYDDGGNDQYRADSGAQGAGCFGYGQLTDVAGNDTYYGARFVQGFAQVMGVGVLTDGAGNDTYYAGGKYLHQPLWNDHYQSLSQGFAIGNRNDAGVGTGGGVALLLDEGDGNDFYSADIYGQGSSYWYSLGFLVDTGGNDVYTLGQYGQGAGIHLSAAGLFDLKGNDAYTMTIGLGQGAAHDWAVGWLIDRAGNDVYQGNGQGMGLNFSVGILLDCAGDDSHSAIGDGSIGKGTNNDISLLLDLAGSDTYGPKEIRDGQFTRRGRHQLVYDVPPGWFPGIDTSTLPTKQDPAPEAVTVQHILIAWDGTGVDTQKAARNKEQAEALARRVLKLARSKGADWKQLQADYNEDCAANPDGSTNTHNSYTAEPEARLVKPFKDLALSLGKGQIDICESRFGFHIIKRIE